MKMLHPDNLPSHSSQTDGIASRTSMDSRSAFWATPTSKGEERMPEPPAGALRTLFAQRAQMQTLWQGAQERIPEHGLFGAHVLQSVCRSQQAHQDAGECARSTCNKMGSAGRYSPSCTLRSCGVASATKSDLHIPGIARHRPFRAKPLRTTCCSIAPCPACSS